MKFTMNKQAILKAVSRCQSVADKKSTMPVLANVLLQADGDQVTVSATDLFVSLKQQLASKVDTHGSFCVGARELFERLRAMPDGNIAFAIEGTKLLVKSVGASRRFTLHGVPGEEFPSLPAPDAKAQAATLDVVTLASLISATHFSISTDETRLHLNSALFEWDNDRVRMVTTDGHRLSKLEVVVKGKHESATMLIPLKGVQELRRLCEEALGEGGKEGSDATEIKMVQSGPNAFFELAGFSFSVKLVDAQFPPYQQVIPDKSERTVTVNRTDLIDSVRSVSLSSSDRTGGIRMAFRNERLALESEAPDKGEGFDEVATDYTGPAIDIGINARYVLDVLGAISEQEVEILSGAELDPCVIRPAGRDDYTAVIMPMRI